MLLLQVLEKRKGAFAWKMSDIKGISLSYCTHKILMEDDYKPVIQPQRRLNPKVQDVVKNEIVKLLDSGLIYPISNSSWVSPIHVVPKKRGMTVVLNDNNELIPSRTVTGWRIMPPRMRTRSAGRPVTESQRDGMGELVDELNGQGNDQGLGANGNVEGVNRNVEGVSEGVGEAPEFSMIIA
ncbi:hypothetical protein Tco_0722167 [Tanacetum coccineum]